MIPARAARPDPFLVAALAAVGLCGCLCGCRRTAPALVPPPPAEVVVSRPVAREVTDSVEFTGNVAAVAAVEIKARVSGFVTRIHFEDGQFIAAGDPLFDIDDRPYRIARDSAAADVAKNTAELVELEREVVRYKALLPKAVVTQEQYEVLIAKRDVAQAMLDKARTTVAEADLDLEFCRVVSPLSGRVSTREVDVGDLVSGGSGPSTRLTTVVSVDPVHVSFNPDERSLLEARRQAIDDRAAARGNGSAGEWRNIKELAIPVEVALVNETGFPRRGFLDFVDVAVQPTTGTIRCRAELDNADGLITPGMFVRVRLAAGDPHPALLVPERAVGTDQGDRYLAVVTADNRVEHRRVSLGIAVAADESGSSMLREITAGITADDRVVIDGLIRARAGSLVRPLETTAAAAAATSAEPVAP